MFVIAGVTGNTGSVVAETLLEAGAPVRVVVRDAAKGEAFRARGAEVAVADLDDAAALSEALRGAAGAYLLSPPDAGAEDFLARRRKTVDAIASAIEASGVPHVVFLSSVGAQHDDGTGIIRSVRYAEQRLARTPAKLTFLRAAYLVENWEGVLGAAAAGKLPTFLPPDLVIPMVSTRDIGVEAARALREGPRGKVDVIELAGPRDVSARDVAASLSRSLGRPVEPEAAPLEAVVPAFTSFGMAPGVAEQFRAMYQGIADGTVAWEGGAARHVRGAVGLDEALAPLLPKG